MARFAQITRSLVLAGALAAPFAASVAAPASADPVYMIATVDVKDFDAFFSGYGMETLPILMQAGAEILVGGGPYEDIEGTWGVNHTVVLKFADRAAFDAFYNDPTYVKTREKRFATSGENKIIVIDQFKMPTQ